MKKPTFGTTIAMLRKEKGMTQLELAQKMGVTDKAVSKWERDLSFPDVSSIPKLAEIFGVSVDALMLGEIDTKQDASGSKVRAIVHLALQGIALAMGIEIVVLSLMDQMDVKSAVVMLGIGLACLSASQLSKSR